MRRIPIHRWLCCVLLFLGAISFSACKKEPHSSLDIITPHAPRAFAPSFAELVAGESYNQEVNDDVAVCASCHPHHVQDWQSSAHAFSSFNNPLYRVAFDDYVKEAGQEKAPFCGGCHDPSLLFAGGLKKPVQPYDARGHVGVSCNGCHGIDGITFDGVGSYQLSTAPIPLPKENDAASLAAHIKRVGKPVLKTNEFCISCHRGFLSQGSGHETFVAALDEYGPWRRSAHAGTESRFLLGEGKVQSCVDCHMPAGPQEKVLHSHRFVGGHTTLAAMLADSKQLEAQQAFLKNRVQVDVPVWGTRKGKGQLTSESIQVIAGEKLWFDVVVTNRLVGHQYPGGARDLRNAWIEVELFQEGKGTVAISVDSPELLPAEQRVHRLHVGMLDDEGKLVKTHDVSHFRSAAFDHTIAPHDSRTIRYTWRVPKEWASIKRFKVKVRVVQKRLSEEFFQRVCSQSVDGRGAEFVDATFKYLNKKVNPCASQLTTVMAKQDVTLGADSTALESWERWYRHGLGLRHGAQEKMRMAAYSLENASKNFPKDGALSHRAAIHSALAEVKIRQGRSEDALQEVHHLEELLGSHPLVARLRGEAYSIVWQLREAGKWYEEAAQKAPLDDALWRMAAISYGSDSDYSVAFRLAAKGLELEPRDNDLLRLQMIAAKRLNAPPKIVHEAEKAFLDFRQDELASARKARCSREFPECRLEREPFHVHELLSTFMVGKGGP